MIDFDEFVFFGETPTEWLQARLYEPGRRALVRHRLHLRLHLLLHRPVRAPPGVLWARDRLAFLRFAKRLVTLAIAGLATYIAFPAAPPWMAGEEGLLDGVHRTTGEGLGSDRPRHRGDVLPAARTGVNLVAAVPSLHSAFVALVAFFLWGRVRPWVCGPCCCSIRWRWA